MFRCLQQTRQLSTTMVASKPKSDITLVQLQSTVSDFKKQALRNRLGDKLETMDFDPFVQKRMASANGSTGRLSIATCYNCQEQTNIKCLFLCQIRSK